MHEMLRAISENPLIPIGGILLGVIGIFLAIIFYIRSRRVSRVRYDYSGRSLVEGLSGALEGLEVRYNGALQDRITVSRFVFWNAGTETIRACDFTDDPLRITCNQGIAILDFRIVEANDTTNKVEIDAAENAEREVSLKVKFDYLDPSDGAVVQIVHNGDERTEFNLTGSLKGNCSIRLSESPAYRMARVYRLFPIFGALMKSSWFAWLLSLAGLGYAISALVLLFRGGPWWLLALSAVFILLTCVMIYVYATGQVPHHFRRELGKLPTANKPSEATQ